MKIPHAIPIALLGCVIAAPSFGALAKNDRPGRNQNWMVACQKLPVHSSDNGFSKTVAILPYKSVVTIKDLRGKYDLPDSQNPDADKSPAEQNDFLSNSVAKDHYAWAQITGPSGENGYVPISCLVNDTLSKGPYEDPSQIMDQRVTLAGNFKPTVSSRGFSKKERGDRVAMRGMTPSDPVQECSDEMLNSESKTTVSSRGFSKREKGDRVAMRGLGSSSSDGICIKEDYQGLKNYIAGVPLVTDSYKHDYDFRKEGGLGEFK